MLAILRILFISSTDLAAKPQHANIARIASTVHYLDTTRTPYLHQHTISNRLNSTSKMCKQLKMGYTKCPRVYFDYEIMPCHAAIEAEALKIDVEGHTQVGNSYCEPVAWEWVTEKTVGRCIWCQELEDDECKAGEKWAKKFVNAETSEKAVETSKKAAEPPSKWFS